MPCAPAGALLLLRALGVAAVLQAGAAQHTAGLGPGWNQRAQKPPMGWRHWNAFGPAIRAGLPGDGSNCSSPGRKCGSVARQIDQLTLRHWDVGGDGGRVSLLDVGYASVGIDEGWEDCGAGVGGRGHHDAQGNPLINAAKFPDMAKLVNYAHGKNLSMGWYLNGCACPDHAELEANYVGDVKVMHALGFDEAKFDGCGALRNSSKYAELMRQTWGARGEPLPAVENCHWGAGGSIGCRGNDDDACPTDEWCPWNWFRVGGDQDAAPDSWFDDLQNVVQFNKGPKPLSRPQCWAYPDMMEVGMVMRPNHTLDIPWNRAHFGAWCIVSSPLILSMDMDDPNLALVIPFITNPEAIKVNQQYAGSPGMLLQSNHVSTALPSDPPPAPHVPADARGFVVFTGMLNRLDDGGKPLRVANMTTDDAESWCNQTAACTCFTAEAAPVGASTATEVLVRFENEPLLCASNGIHVRDNNKKWKTWVKAQLAPDTAESGAQQVWGKPQPDGSWAFVLLNSDSTHPMVATIDLAALPLDASKISTGGAVVVRDVWARAEAPVGLEPVGGLFKPPAVAPRDSAFWLVSPAEQ